MCGPNVRFFLFYIKKNQKFKNICPFRKISKISKNGSRVQYGDTISKLFKLQKYMSVSKNFKKSLNSTTLDNTISIVPSANGSNFLLITRCVMISSIILDFSSVHENPLQLETAIVLCCNINKVLS